MNTKIKTIEFAIPYRVNEDAHLQLRYRLDSDGDDDTKVLPLVEVIRGEWSGVLSLDEGADTLYYGYEYVRDGKVVRNEWNTMPHSVRLNSVNRRYMQYDCWMDSPPGYYMQTGLFRMFASAEPVTDEVSVNWYNRSVTFSIYLLGLSDGEQPAVAGDAQVLGAWNTDEALPLHNVAPNLWSVTFDAQDIWSGCIHFKIIVRRADGTIFWEPGENRIVALADLEKSTAHNFSLGLLSVAQPSLHLAGTVIPLFSLRSESSWGIGDFGDLKKMVDWLAKTGQNVLQLLPVNDTTIFGGKEDSYPYNCVSVFALNPIYADIESLPRLSDTRWQYYRKRAKELNALPTVEYAAVYNLKISYLHELFDQKGEVVLSTNACRAFARAQRSWLRPYTLYRFFMSHLRCNPSGWGRYSRYDDSVYASVLAEYSEAERELDFHTFVQYILFSQLSDAHSYANSKRVALKGDIPIGVAPNGADVWCDPSQFNLTVSAGAPPDAFSANGQNWGFPTYNWELMATQGYEWWRSRLQYMSNFFDAYRIDHILGFFRIWEIPRWAKSGLAGTFSPSRPFTREELETAGFMFDVKRHTRAYVSRDAVNGIFRHLAAYIISQYFDICADGNLTFKEKFLNPHALYADLYSAGSPVPYEQKEEVLRLYGEVLFFCDDKGFTPRIDAASTLAYRLLSDCGRAAYDRLYEEYYYRRHTLFWYEEGMRKLMPVLLSTPMTACGEDLGMIPDCVPWVMRNLQIMSLEIQRMPKLYGQAFARPSEYPYLSVATPSTHDMSTLREWWCEDRGVAQHFYNSELGYDGEAPKEMSSDIATQIITSHLESPALLALFAWQDFMAMDERLRRDNPREERINEPSNRNHVWCYRMHISIEQLLDEDGFNTFLYSMIKASGRVH